MRCSSMQADGGSCCRTWLGFVAHRPERSCEFRVFLQMLQFVRVVALEGGSKYCYNRGRAVVVSSASSHVRHHSGNRPSLLCLAITQFCELMSGRTCLYRDPKSADLHIAANGEGSLVLRAAHHRHVGSSSSQCKTCALRATSDAHYGCTTIHTHTQRSSLSPPTSCCQLVGCRPVTRAPLSCSLLSRVALFLPRPQGMCAAVAASGEHIPLIVWDHFLSHRSLTLEGGLGCHQMSAWPKRAAELS